MCVWAVSAHSLSFWANHRAASLNGMTIPNVLGPSKNCKPAGLFSWWWSLEVQRTYSWLRFRKDAFQSGSDEQALQINCVPFEWMLWRYSSTERVVRVFVLSVLSTCWDCPALVEGSFQNYTRTRVVAAVCKKTQENARKQIHLTQDNALLCKLMHNYVVFQQLRFLARTWTGVLFVL